jgi:hypothetical protein
MHDLSKGSRQRVFDMVQERRVSIEVGKSLRLELKTLATEITVDELKHRTLGGVGEVYGGKSSQDRLLI